MSTGVYVIASKKEPYKCYIGSSINIEKRVKRHFAELWLKKHHSYKLQHHFNEHGADDLHFWIQKRCLKKDLITTEQYYINHFQPFFNINPIAENRLGSTHSNATKLKISEKAKKRPRLPMHIRLFGVNFT